MSKFVLRLTAIAAATLAASATLHAQSITAVAGKTEVGTQPSGMKSFWSDWYAGQPFSLAYSVNGAFNSAPNWTTVERLPTAGTVESAAKKLWGSPPQNARNHLDFRLPAAQIEAAARHPAASQLNWSGD